MKPRKRFDAVQLKNTIHARLHRQQAGMTDEEIEQQRREWLATANTPLARWWRARAPEAPRHAVSTPRARRRKAG